VYPDWAGRFGTGAKIASKKAEMKKLHVVKIFFCIFLWQARVFATPLLMSPILYICEMSGFANPESCRSKQARNPSPYNLATHLPRRSKYSLSKA
jgi:hypothetical protein